MAIKITLRAARVNAGLNLIPAAAAIGVGKDTLIKWEKNPALVKPEYQKAIVEVYGVPVNSIIFFGKN